MLEWVDQNGLLTLFIVFAVGITLFHLLEPLAPVIRGTKAGVTRRGYFADVIALLVNGPGLSSLEKIAFSWLLLCVPAPDQFLGQKSWWVQFGVFFLTNDFLRYWFHRWYHEFEVLWRVHRVHHTVVEMDAMSVFRHHILEAIIKNGLIFLPLRLLGVSDSVILIYSAIDIFKGLWHHANLRSYIGPLNYIFNSPELHWWHHETDAKGQMSNYGSVLSIWDVLFGTFLYRPRRWPSEIGVQGMKEFPSDYVGQFASIRHDDRGMVLACQSANAGDRAIPKVVVQSSALPAAQRFALPETQSSTSPDTQSTALTVTRPGGKAELCTTGSS